MTNRCFTQTKKHITANHAIWTPNLGYSPTYVTGMDSDKLAMPLDRRAEILARSAEGIQCRDGYHR